MLLFEKEISTLGCAPRMCSLRVLVFLCNYSQMKDMLKLMLNTFWHTGLNNSINPSHHFAGDSGAGIIYWQ